MSDLIFPVVTIHGHRDLLLNGEKTAKNTVIWIWVRP